MTPTLLLSTAYFPPIWYFAYLQHGGRFILEQNENYQRKSYRNRCVILSGNGPLPLVIPVRKGLSPKIPILEAWPDYGVPWQKLHWISIRSAYGASPFFQDYAFHFEPFFRQKELSLFDLNEQLLSLILQLVGISGSIDRSEAFLSPDQDLPGDLRYRIHPRQEYKEDPFFSPVPYYQVFSDRFGFCPNLSIADLLFNEGPATLEVLQRSFRPESETARP